MSAKKKSEGRNPQAERRPRTEIGDPWSNVSTPDSACGFRISFGLRISDLGFTLVLLLVLALVSGLAQVIGPIKGFKVAEAYEAPHQAQLKFLLEGAQAETLDKDRTLLTEARLHTYRMTGEPELFVSAPHALYDASLQTINSSGPLHVQTADGKFSIEGEGFLWRETNSSLLISNRVHTVIEPGLLDTSATNSHSLNSSNGPVDVYSERFTYDHEAGLGLYLGKVRVIGTNRDLSLTSGLLRVKVPALERQLQTITAETNVVIDYAGLHATGRRADYSVSNGLAHITGEPAWRAPPREGRGDELVIDRTNRLFQANGHAWMKMPGTSLGASTFLFGTNATPAVTTKDTNQVVEVWSDSYEFRTNWGVFRNHVRVREHRGPQDLRLMSCQVLTVTLAGTNELQTLVAERNVEIQQETNRLAGDRAVYTATNGILELTGKPSWHAGPREGRGDRLQLSRDYMFVSGNASMRLPAEELAQPTTRTNQPRRRAAAPQFAEIYSQDYTLRTNNALFRGGVYATHPSMNLACERLEVQLGTGGGRVVTAEQSVVFDLKDERGQTMHGGGDKAVYTVTVGSVTNNLLHLTGKPAMVQTTNGLATAPLLVLNRTTGDLSAPGGDYHFQGTAPGLDTNKLVLPKLKISK